MATVTMTGDEVVVHQLVGTRTFLRARGLVTRGEVLDLLHDTEGEYVDVLRGAVGPRDGRTSTVALLERRPQGGLIQVTGSCSCQEPNPCQHSVALTLAHLGAGGPSGPGRGPARGPGPASVPGAGAAGAPPRRDRAGARAVAAPVPPAWAGVLDTLLVPAPAGVSPEPRTAASAGASAQVALQFEVGRTPPRRVPGHGGRGAVVPAAVHVLVRPVRRSDAGNWVRTGMSWRILEQLGDGYSSGYGYARQRLPLGTRELHLLEELSALRARPTYEDQDGRLDLAQVSSRRVWDLLAEIREAGMPLTWASRGGDEVALLARAVHAGVDVVSLPEQVEPGGGAGLTVRAQLAAEGVSVPVDRHLLLGRPAHGVLWWPPDGDPVSGAPSRVLCLAPLAAPVTSVVAGLLERGPVTVPAAEADLFLREFYPRLHERVPVGSSDGSVVLPQAEPPRLTLGVTADPAAGRAVAHWSWLVRLGATQRTEPLIPGSGETADALDRDSLDRVTARLAARFADLPDLFETAPGGPDPAAAPRLAARVQLDGLATARFFAEVLPHLESDPDVDVDVEIPPTAAVRDYRALDGEPVIAFDQTDRTGPATAPGEHPDWFDLAVTVTVDGHAVPFQELFTALAQQQTHLLLPDGAYFSLDREPLQQLGRLIAESRALLDAPAATVRLTRFQLGAWQEVEQLGTLNGPSTAAWRESVQALRDAAAGQDGVDRTRVPDGLDAELRPYQRSGLDWLAALYRYRLGGVLADDMGLGKTLQVLALVLHARQDAPDAPAFLVVAPTSVVANWASEAARFAPGLVTATVTETAARRGRPLSEIAAGTGLVITSYTLFRLEHADYAQLGWSGLVLDEAQAVKNHQSAGYRCARDLAVPFKLAVTGTPVENNLMELWALMSLTAPGLFATAARFAEHYRTGIERDRDPEVLEQLRRRLRPLMLRRTKQLVAADLPDKQEQVLELDLHPRHRLIYDKYLHRERQKVLGLLGDLRRNRFEIFRSLTLLRQAALDVALVDPAHAAVGSTKLDTLMDQLRDIAGEGHRVLVFSQFTRFLSQARDRLDAAGIEYCYLDGSTRNRPAVIDRFRTGTAPVFLISLKAGGTGLTLTEADYVILLDPWWNPATEAQAVDRVHRIGQTRKVMVYRLVAKDTIEDKVMALKATKSALISSVLDAGDLSSGALQADDIRALLS